MNKNVKPGLPLKSGTIGKLSHEDGTISPATDEELSQNPETFTKDDIAAIVELMREDDGEDLAPEYAVDPNAKPKEVEVKDISDLDEEQQEELKKVINKFINNAPKTDERKKPVSPKAEAEELLDRTEKVIQRAEKVVEEKKIELTSEMKEKFLRAVLSNTSYEAEFRAARGKLRMTFRTVSMKENDTISEAIHLLAEQDKVTNVAQARFMSLRLNIIFSLARLETQGVDENGTPKNRVIVFPNPLDEFEGQSVSDRTSTSASRPLTDAEKLIMAHEARLTNLGVIVFNVIHREYTKFEDQVNQLALEFASPDF